MKYFPYFFPETKLHPQISDLLTCNENNIYIYYLIRINYLF